MRTQIFRGMARTFIKPALSPRVPDGARRRWIGLLTKANLTPRGTRYEAVDMDGVPGERVTVGTLGEGVVLYLHGGAYGFGSAATHRSITAHLARDASATVYVPDYRLAPEHPYPAAVEDATRAYGWLLDQGVAAERIVIAGDSAGGGLAVATAIALRDAGTSLPAGLLALSPWVDLSCSDDNMRRLEKSDPMLSVSILSNFAQSYLAGQDPQAATASPLFGDLSGLPPLCIHASSDEIVRFEAERLAERARETGVTVETRTYDGLWHAFQLHAGALPAATAAVGEAADFARRCWSTGQS